MGDHYSLKGKLIQITHEFDDSKDYGLPIQGGMVKRVLSDLKAVDPQSPL